MKKYNFDQRKYLSDFLNGLSIAWFTAGVIAPLFIGVSDFPRFVLQISGSIGICIVLLILGISFISKK